MLNEVIDKLDLDMTYTELYKMVDVADVDSTQIMQITVTDTDAERAGEIAQTIADIVPDVLVEKVEAGSCKAVSDVIYRSQQGVPPDQEVRCAGRSAGRCGGVRRAGAGTPAARYHCG